MKLLFDSIRNADSFVHKCEMQFVSGNSILCCVVCNLWLDDVFSASVYYFPRKHTPKTKTTKCIGAQRGNWTITSHLNDVSVCSNRRAEPCRSATLSIAWTEGEARDRRHFHERIILLTIAMDARCELHSGICNLALISRGISEVKWMLKR